MTSDTTFEVPGRDGKPLRFCLAWGPRGTRLDVRAHAADGSPVRSDFVRRFVRELIRREEPGPGRPFGYVHVDLGGGAPPSIVLGLRGARAEEDVAMYKWVRASLDAAEPRRSGARVLISLGLEHGCDLLR